MIHIKVPHVAFALRRLCPRPGVHTAQEDKPLQAAPFSLHPTRRQQHSPSQLLTASDNYYEYRGIASSHALSSSSNEARLFLPPTKCLSSLVGLTYAAIIYLPVRTGHMLIRTLDKEEVPRRRPRANLHISPT